jgi:hypothetical protein
MDEVVLIPGAPDNESVTPASPPPGSIAQPSPVNMST